MLVCNFVILMLQTEVQPLIPCQGKHLGLQSHVRLSRPPDDKAYRTRPQAAIYKRPNGTFGFPSAWYCCAETMTGTRLNMRSCNGKVTGCRLLSFRRRSRLLMPLITSECGWDESNDAGAAFLGRLMSSVLQAAHQRSCSTWSTKGLAACLDQTGVAQADVVLMRFIGS